MEEENYVFLWLSFRRAMEYEDDLVWIMACYYNLMRAICMIYYWDNESEYMNMMDHLMSCFWEDLREFVEKEKMAESKENKKKYLPWVHNVVWNRAVGIAL